MVRGNTVVRGKDILIDGWARGLELGQTFHEIQAQGYRLSRETIAIYWERLENRMKDYYAQWLRVV